MDNKSVLSFNKKQLRKTEKKIRRLKEKKHWNMDKISTLERESSILSNKIKLESIKKDYGNNQDKMTSDEWIDYFHEVKVEEVEDYKLPNTPKMRRHKKKVIQNLNEHLLGQYMDQKMELRMNIIHQIKNNLGEDKKDKDMDEFFRVRNEINKMFTS
tara:strand:+ start:84 stop:554 length:471 start_codon:yes stop_codon:yes gene_type:complete